MFVKWNESDIQGPENCPLSPILGNLSAFEEICLTEVWCTFMALMVKLKKDIDNIFILGKTVPLRGDVK